MNMLPLVAWALLSSPQPSQGIDFKDAWSKVQSGISQRYYARQARKGDMDRLFAKYQPIAEKAKSKSEFDKAVNGMIEEFGDSHFALLTDEDQGYYMMENLANPSTSVQMPQIGIWAKPVSGGYAVQMVMEGSDAFEAGVRRGDLLKTIDGQPYSPVLALKGKENRTVKLGYVHNGQAKTAECEVRSANGLDMFLRATRDSVRIIEVGGKKIGYIHLWTQASDEFRNALKAAVLGRLRDTDAFILDLRDGFGGRPENFFEPFFMPDMPVTYKVGGITQSTAMGYGLQKPMAVLINEGSRSAKEVSALMFKKSKRATVIGTTTAGHVLGTYPWRITPWAFLEIPMAEVEADGQKLEKVGVSPDVRVSPEFDAFSGKDLVIEAAVNLLRK
jgi:carboxyl-terminal processing protease